MSQCALLHVRVRVARFGVSGWKLGTGVRLCRACVACEYKVSTVFEHPRVGELPDSSSPRLSAPGIHLERERAQKRCITMCLCLCFYRAVLLQRCCGTEPEGIHGSAFCVRSIHQVQTSLHASIIRGFIWAWSKCKTSSSNKAHLRRVSFNSLQTHTSRHRAFGNLSFPVLSILHHRPKKCPFITPYHVPLQLPSLAPFFSLTH